MLERFTYVVFQVLHALVLPSSVKTNMVIDSFGYDQFENNLVIIFMHFLLKLFIYQCYYE